MWRRNNQRRSARLQLPRNSRTQGRAALTAAEARLLPAEAAEAAAEAADVAALRAASAAAAALALVAWEARAWAAAPAAGGRLAQVPLRSMLL